MIDFSKKYNSEEFAEFLINLLPKDTSYINKDLKIDKNFEILVMCGSGNRSQRAAELLTEKGFKCLNVSDGFRGDGGEKIGWKNNQLPTK